MAPLRAFFVPAFGANSGSTSLLRRAIRWCGLSQKAQRRSQRTAAGNAAKSIREWYDIATQRQSAKPTHSLTASSCCARLLAPTGCSNRSGLRPSLVPQNLPGSPCRHDALRRSWRDRKTRPIRSATGRRAPLPATTDVSVQASLPCGHAAHPGPDEGSSLVDATRCVTRPVGRHGCGLSPRVLPRRLRPDDCPVTVRKTIRTGHWRGDMPRLGPVPKRRTPSVRNGRFERVLSPRYRYELRAEIGATCVAEERPDRSARKTTQHTRRRSKPMTLGGASRNPARLPTSLGKRSQSYIDIAFKRRKKTTLSYESRRQIHIILKSS